MRELSAGNGTHAVLEAVGYKDAYQTALGVVRPAVSSAASACRSMTRRRSGSTACSGRNLTLTGGPAPVRAYIDELLPGVLDGTVQPGKVFDRTVSLDEVPEGYRAMNDRQALKVLIQP